MSRIRTAVVFISLVFFSGMAAAQAGAKLLVAQPDLAPPYSGTVLLVIPVGDAQHMGLILNRPLDEKLGALIPQVPPAGKVVDPVRFGGPMMADRVFAIATAPEDPKGESLPVTGDVVVAISSAVIGKILEQQPNDARYFLGFVGWEPGELESELAKGFWYVTEPNQEMLLRRSPKGLWKELVERLEIAQRGI